MTNKNLATVIRKDDVVEELVVLLINNIHVRCFLSYCPHPIEVGADYEVELEIVLPDGEYAEEAEENRVGVKMIGEGFSCVLNGYLNDGTFSSFVDFHEQEIHFDYPNLNNKYIKVRADRIDVSIE